MIRHATVAACCALLLSVPSVAAEGQAVDRASAVGAYADHVHRAYQAAHEAAVGLQQAVQALVDQPSQETLVAARRAWKASRLPYGRTEAFRYYSGPIDRVDPEVGEEGRELRMNAWPVNEAGIDAVAGRADAGLVMDASIPLDRATLVRRNALHDERDVTTGFHAIEFLLWGQDHSAEGPGERPASDFVGDGPAARRRAYLRIVTDLLVDDLAVLVDEWAPGEANFRRSFVAAPGPSLVDAWTGVERLTGFEMAMERLAVALDSRDQEDEHSCFSDTTHLDFLSNIEGIRGVVVGLDGRAGLADWLATKQPALARRLVEQVDRTHDEIRKLHAPFDQILTAPDGDERRAQAERVVASLQTLSDLLSTARSLARAGQGAAGRS